MSLKNWKKMFLSVDANSSSIKTEDQAIRHSLLKWLGLQGSALKAFGLNLEYTCVEDTNGNSLAIDSDNCALCAKYWRDGFYSKAGCNECPIVLRTGQTCHEAYDVFEENNNPEPMIRLLLETLNSKNIEPSDSSTVE